MNTPTPEQLLEWVTSAAHKDRTGSWRTLAHYAATLAYQAGRESMLAELRAGGVELPRVIAYKRGYSSGKQTPCVALDEALNYGDRRAAAERERIKQENLRCYKTPEAL